MGVLVIVVLCNKTVIKKLIWMHIFVQSNPLYFNNSCDKSVSGRKFKSR